jgi:hypothetical protein
LNSNKHENPYEQHRNFTAARHAERQLKIEVAYKVLLVVNMTVLISWDLLVRKKLQRLFADKKKLILTSVSSFVTVINRKLLAVQCENYFS